MSRFLKSNIFHFSVVLQLFSFFGFFISLFVVIMARQRMRVRFCTRKVPGRWSLQFFFDDCIAATSRKNQRTQDSRTITKKITKTIAFGIKNRPCEKRPFFPFPLPFLSFFLSLPFPSPFLIPFIFLFFSFRFPFLFLGAVLLRRCQKMSCMFRGKRSTGHVHRHFA